MIIKVKTLVFCENFEYGDVHVMSGVTSLRKCSHDGIKHTLFLGFYVTRENPVFRSAQFA